MKIPTEKLSLFLLVALFVVLVVHTATVKSPTWDEVGYFGLGAYLLTSWQWDVAAAASHPPLAYFLHGLPLVFHGSAIDPELWRAPAHLATDVAYLRSADLERGNALLLDESIGEQWFIASRLMSILLAAPLFACLISWSRQLGGARWPVALGLAVLSPNLLAHASLITTDFALTVTYFGAAFCLRRYLHRPSWTRLITAGCAVGLALLSKLSGLLILPAGGLACAWYLFRHTESQQGIARLIPLGRPWLSACVSALVTGVIAAAGVWVAHGFQLQPYVAVVRSQLWDLGSGHQSYLMGEISSDGWWYYFPIAVAIKTPLPVLILAIAGLVALARTSRRDGFGDFGFAVLPPVILALAFIVGGGGKNIGLRYLLPVYPFLFLWASSAFAATPRRGAVSEPRSLRRRAAISLLMIWMAISTWRIHPHHLAYFNELVGGPANGHRYLVDSNLDWGQDLKGLKAYCEARGVERIKLSYFGSVDPALYDLNYEWLPSYHLPTRGRTHIELPTAGTIAISATNLVGVYMAMYGHEHGLYSWLRQYEPVDHIGHSILVFEVPETAGLETPFPAAASKP